MPRQVVYSSACLPVWKQVFSQTSMAELREKSKLLTTYMEYLLLTRHGQPTDQNPSSARSKNRPYLKIITPADPEQRGSQLSIWFSVHVGLVFRELSLRGVVVIYVYGWLPLQYFKVSVAACSDRAWSLFFTNFCLFQGKVPPCLFIIGVQSEANWRGNSSPQESKIGRAPKPSRIEKRELSDICGQLTHFLGS